MTANGFITSTAGFVLVAACAGSGDFAIQPRLEARRGVIEFFEDTVGIILPDTVLANVPANISVRTHGGGCISQGETRVSVDGLLAVIEPFDSVVVGDDLVCTTELWVFTHTALLQFGQTGIATARIIGIREPSGDTISVDRIVVVR